MKNGTEYLLLVVGILFASLFPIGLWVATDQAYNGDLLGAMATGFVFAMIGLVFGLVSIGTAIKSLRKSSDTNEEK